MSRTGHRVYSVDGMLIADTSSTVTGTDSGDTPGVPLSAHRGLELGYAEITTAFGGAGQTASLSAVTGLSVTVECDGVNPVEIEFGGQAQKLTNAGGLFCYIYEGSDLMCLGGHTLAVNGYGYINCKVRTIPTAGEHTYFVQMLMSSAGGQIMASAIGGSSGPAFISVTGR